MVASLDVAQVRRGGLLMESRSVLWHSSKGLTRLGRVLTEHRNMCWAAGHIVRLWATEGKVPPAKKKAYSLLERMCAAQRWLEMKPDHKQLPVCSTRVHYGARGIATCNKQIISFDPSTACELGIIIIGTVSQMQE